MNRKRELTTFQIISISFTAVILIGAFLLMLPFSTRTGQSASFMEALFTSTSAVCVTGLVVQDTGTYWSAFGQGVILILIQIGGLGIISIAALFNLISGKKIGLMQRSTMQEAISAPMVGGIVRLTKFAIKATICFELIGAVIMMPVFCKEFGAYGIWLSIFHSISAFCNAGFDIMGFVAPGSSLTHFVFNPIINIVVVALIVIGGIGFLTWEDIKTNKFKIHKYQMQSKAILLVTLLLIIIPTLYFLFFEFSSGTFGNRLLESLFQAVTPRTAGFNTVDLTSLTQGGKFLIILLMLVGGSSGSTAGGMKTNTVAVIFATAFSVFKRKNEPSLFGRRISDETVRQALTVLLMYITLFACSGFLICRIENLPLLSCLFETASALGTTGLSLGITSQLCTVSKIILIVLMFMGRVGGLTIIYAAVGSNNNLSKLPLAKITVG